MALTVSATQIWVSRLVTRPIVNSRRGGSAGIGFGANTDSPRGRTVFHASHSRYAAPASFTAVYTAGTRAKIVAMPAVAATRYTPNPAATPSREIRPARRPWVTDRDTR